MSDRLLVGLDFGTAAVRAVVLDAGSGAQVAVASRDYAHGTLTARLPGGEPVPPGFHLQVAGDYERAAEAVLREAAGGREVAAIGIGFTASSPLPARADGTPLSDLRPGDPHAYVKLWKHAAQDHAARIAASGLVDLRRFGGRLSGEWLLPKALELAEGSPDAWDMAERFIEAGDWMAWRLTGVEARGMGFAVYKAQWDGADYPDAVPGLRARLMPPVPVGSAVGPMSGAWRERTGVRGEAVVAAAVIDGHVVLPAVGAVRDGDFVGSLGTSAAFLFQSSGFRDLPPGVEGVARGGALPDLWTYEAGTAAFGDALAWFAGLARPGEDLGTALPALDAEADAQPPGRLLALDWWGGSRALSDARLSGAILGLRVGTPPGAIHRALCESLCFGARRILEALEGGGLPAARVLMTSGVAERSPFLMQLMAEVLGRPVAVPRLPNATAVGAAVHGAVAAGVVGGYEEGAARFGAREAAVFEPRRPGSLDALCARYLALSGNEALREAMRHLSGGDAT